MALALHGAEAAFPDGPPAWPVPDPAVRQALDEAYQSGDWGRYHGPHRAAFEARLAEHHQVQFARACCSGTFAVELALRALQVGADHEVILAGYDFPGNFRAVERVGARPVLVDIDPLTWCLDARRVGEGLTPDTRAVIVSHLHGGQADMPAIRELADRHEVAVIEDACQATGAVMLGRPAGSWGDVGVLSFGGSKLVTAGRGGALLTDRADVAQRAKVFCEQGNDAFPLSELQAAVLQPQWEKLAERNRVRAESVRRLRLATTPLHDLGWQPVAEVAPTSHASYYKFAWRLGGETAEQRPELIRALQAEGLAIDAGFRGFAGRSERRCRQVGDLAASRQAAQATLILHHPVLLEPAAVIDRLGQALVKVATALASS